jgi:hypothetical protein
VLDTLNERLVTLSIMIFLDWTKISMFMWMHPQLNLAQSLCSMEKTTLITQSIFIVGSYYILRIIIQSRRVGDGLCLGEVLKLLT